MTGTQRQRGKAGATTADRVEDSGEQSGTNDANEPGAPFDLSSNVNYLLRRAHQRADELFAEAMAGLDVTPRQATLLHVIGQNEGASLSELARYSGIDRGSISGMVPRLERRGLLTQGRADSDGRAKALVLRPAGEALVADVVRLTDGLAERVLSGLPEEYHLLLVKMLRQLVGLEVETRQLSDGF